jgi:ankyrin repeat protein
MRTILYLTVLGLSLVPATVRAEEILDAAQVGDVARVKRILAANPELARGRKGEWGPLHWAADGGHNELVLLLLAHGADINQPLANGATPLYLAVQWNRRRTVGLLLARGANVNAADDDGCTVLHIAAAECDPGMVELLLCYGANVRARSKQGTPLQLAVRNNNTVVADMLRHAGAKE